MKQILIVDDNQVLAKVMKQYLAAKGFDARVVPTIADARSTVAEHPPELILLDRYLPDASGLEMAREMSEAGITVVVVSAASEENSREEFIRRGVAAYLPKPFSLDTLAKVMNCVLAGNQCLPDCSRGKPCPHVH